VADAATFGLVEEHFEFVEELKGNPHFQMN
jgi:hypothetical protein